MNKYLALLRLRPAYRNLWLASLISFLGDWFNTIASVMIVNRYTETDLAVSWILIARTVPRFLVLPLAGVAADRFNRKTIMVVSDLLRAGIVLSFLWIDRPERVWLIYALTVAQFVVAAFFEPASSAIIPGLVKGEQELVTANILSSVTWSAMLAIGAAFGGVFAGLLGAELALIADAVTFLISAGFLFSIPYIGPTREIDAVRRRKNNRLIEGFGYVLRHPRIAVLALVKTMGQVGNTDLLIVVFSERYFPYGQEGALTLGILFGAGGLGAVLGPMISNRLIEGSSSSLRRAISSGFVLVPLGWLLVSWSPNLLVVALGVMVRFMGGSINWTYSNVLLQQVVPDKLLGRVFAFDRGMFTLATSVSIFLTGYFLDQPGIGPRKMGGYFALISLLPVAIWIAHLLAIRGEPELAREDA